MMTEHVLRFAARSPEGFTSDLWRLSTRTGTGKNDAYLVCLGLGKISKASFHETGSWNYSFIGSDPGKVFPGGDAPPSRHMSMTVGPPTMSVPIVLMGRVVWQSECITVPQRTDGYGRDDIRWLPQAPPGNHTEVAIFAVRGQPLHDDWPGKDAMETVLVGRLPIEGGHIAVVARECPTPPLPSSLEVLRGYASSDESGHPIPDLGRALTVSVNEVDGSLQFVEWNVTVKATD